jgi:hypothetical protein
MTPEYLSDDDLIAGRRSRRLAALENEIDTPILPSLQPWHWAVAGLLVVGFSSFLWLGHHGKSGVDGVQLIQADSKPFKIKPENPGGLEVPFQEMQVYGALPGNADQAEIKRQDTVDQIQPPPEEPMDRPGRDAGATRIVTAENAENSPKSQESLFGADVSLTPSSEEEMPPPAGGNKVGETAADENLPGFLSESLPSARGNEVAIQGGLLPSDQIDMPKLVVKTVDPEKTPVAPIAAIPPVKESRPAEQPLQADAEGRVIHQRTINAAIPAQSLAPEPAIQAEKKPLDLTKAGEQSESLLRRDEVRKMVVELPDTPKFQQDNKKGGTPFEIAAKPPVIEGYPIKTTGPTVKNQKGQDVIDIRSPNREPPLEIRSDAAAKSPPTPAKNLLAAPEKTQPVEKAKLEKPMVEIAKAVVKPETKVAPPKNVSTKVSAPVPAPVTTPVTTPVAAGGWRIQVAAVPDQALALAEWRRYKARHGDILGSLDVKVQRVDLGAKGIFFRVQAGLLDKSGADNACSTLKQRGVSCLVVRD